MRLGQSRRARRTAILAAGCALLVATPAAATAPPASETRTAPWQSSSTAANDNCSAADTGATCTTDGSADVAGRLISYAHVASEPDATQTNRLLAVHTSTVHVSVPTPSLVGMQLLLHTRLDKLGIETHSADFEGYANIELVASGTAPCTAGTCAVSTGPWLLANSDHCCYSLGTIMTTPIYLKSNDPEALLAAGVAELDVSLIATAGLDPTVPPEMIDYAPAPNPYDIGDATADAEATLVDVTSFYDWRAAAPNDFVAEGTPGGLVTLSWMPPPSPLPINGYRVVRTTPYCQDDSCRTVWTLKPSVTRLRDHAAYGQAYRYAVSAISDGGAGVESTAGYVWW